MTAYNLRSLLVAAIVLSNCITWTASRHHYRHNIHGHRTRHRRQGAGLYLSASYVIPGGEGTGWGEWGEDTPCSRTCGGGVASQKRICLQIGPDGQPQCTGGDTRYFSCETQDCPPDSNDFRAEQCAAFNDKEFRGFKYDWVPYTKAPNPCELNCMPHGERFYYRHKAKVIDGTRCNDDSFDVCVDGVCQPVGCDMMLGSNAREDNCRECRGNGANCQTTGGIIDTQDLLKGYNDILLIPAGSTTILIEEIAPSNNYLALRNQNGTYYLNGHYHIDFPRSLMIAGALWNYERSQQGYPAPDKLKCLGPTNEPLYLSLLLQDDNVGIKYEYSVPNNVAPYTDKRYNWVHEEFSPCSASCGGGYQTRNVTCRSSEELEVVAEDLCDDGLKPAGNQTCNTESCPAEWVEGPWSECSKRCGKDGVRKREVTCQKIIANGVPSLVDKKECFDLYGPTELFQECNRDAACPSWFIGRWKACDKLCDEGKQTRQVVCYQKTNGRVEILDDKECEGEKPETEKPCMLALCDGVDWITTDWSGCDTCLSTVRTRVALCASKTHQVYNESLCAYHTKPVTEEACDKKTLPPCDVQWYATQWSKCSVECGKGVQTRKVFCGLYDGTSVAAVEDEKCADQPKYNDTKPCEVPKEECPSQWFAGPWTECSKVCGGGEQYRRVMCLRGNKEDTDCEAASVLDSIQGCNKQPCDADELMPVSPSATTIIDEFCDDDEDYDGEIGLDLVTSEMMSDSPYSGSYGEPESTLNTDSISGSGDGLTTDDFEGSGLSEKDSTDSSITVDVDYSTDDISSTGLTSESPTESSESTVETSTSSGSESSTEAGSTTLGADSSSSTMKIIESSTLSDLSTGSTESTVDSSTSSGSESSTEAGSTTLGADSSSSTMKIIESSTLSDSSTGSTESTVDAGSTTVDNDGSTTRGGSTRRIIETTTSLDISTESSGSTVETSTSSGSESTTGAGSESTVDSSSTGSESSESTTEVTNSSSSLETESTDVSGSTTVSESESTAETTESSTTDSSESTLSETTEESTTGGSTGSGETDLTTEASSTTEEESSDSSTELDSTIAASDVTGSSTADEEKTTRRIIITTSDVTESEGTEGSTLSSEADISSTEGSTVFGESSTETSSVSSTFESSTSGSEATEFSTTESGVSTVESSTSSSGESSSESESTVEVTGTTSSGTESTEVSGSTTVSGSESTEETTESSTISTSESSTSETGSTTEGSTVSSETGSTEESSSTESGSTITEGTGSTVTDVTETEVSTTEASTTEGITLSTGRTTWTFESTVGRKRVCKPRKKIKCDKTTFGCCPDKKTAAAGPFDEGCPKPRTCKEALYGCCPDGVSPAEGEDNEGCPVTPCEETLFGCCQSDNKTASGGNDQEGCPPPPPACVSSEYGCCADEETAATGPYGEGCPETETEEVSTEETATTGSETTEASSSTETSTSSEGSTGSEGSASVTGSSTVVEDCTDTEFGCCYDNETAASGPDGQGCPCNATEFGCCPDGSPAVSDDLSLCQATCRASVHGCCPDGETPAHGPEAEGCCLSTAFGCCPDNRKPAEGPHLEGCGCQFAPNGCCPDNVTIAQGPNNEGCGCQYAQFGCCPDRHTSAPGPDYEGCKCHTYQFGCCPDGVTIAKGPEQQGCHCRQSTYGCCGDEETPAAGPGEAGCDCSASKFGCCPDGQTEATGPKFLGCTDVPEDKQAVCSLPTDPGPCRNFTAIWFYDVVYGGCSRFWYGGCEGNGNKFATQEECEDVCVQPAPKDACKLPASRGPCADEHVRWYYNSTREQCIPFRYGGCLGNANNFDSMEVCQTQCQPERTADTCSLPIEQGQCAGNFSRWGYNTETRTCEQFIWGGCQGNNNRFKTQTACEQRCNPPGDLKPECSEPQETGNCSSKEALWSFSQSENRCMPFYYTGCGGNNNRFESRETCEQICPSAYEPDKCTLPAETGTCANYREKWFYDTSIKRCRLFYYGGCGGNENNFNSETECENTCSERALTTTTTTTTSRPVQPQPAQPHEVQPQPQPEPDREAFCFFEIDAGGRCAAAPEETRFAYDSSLGKCVTFRYFGCGGNQNNFPDEEYCTYYCHPVQDICQLPMLEGPCEASVMRWFYDPTTDSCSQFTYGGCAGNDNRFESREACESRCRTGPGAEHPTQRTTVTTPAPVTVAIDSRLAELIPPECRISPSLEECVSAGVVWYFDGEHHECVSHNNQASGPLCRHTATFSTQEACERGCGAFRGVDVCTQPVDPGPCRAFIEKVYFDQETKTCKQFLYGGCLGGVNRFSSMEECAQVCRPDVDVCTLQPEQGDCNSYVEQWYYDAGHGDCSQFVYTGCGGNNNRFESRADCESRCKAPVNTTITAPVAQPEPAECTTPSSLAPCGANRTVFYYDSTTKSCEVSEFGNCGHPNSYRSEEECERQCGTFRGIDVCRAQLDVGPCRDPVPKFYYESVTGSCQPFTYGGCAGGPNRFSTIEECEEICGDSGPAVGCLQPVDTGHAKDCPAPPVPRYHYSTSRVDCIVFLYEGCGGNDNNFPTYEECRQNCIPFEQNEVGCESYERQCASLQCSYGVVRLSAPGGCESCMCADNTADCTPLEQECAALVCPFGQDKIQEDGCERCVCREDPCQLANCSSSERCAAVAYLDPATREPKYTARCLVDEVDQGNEVLPDCSDFEAHCASLSCEFGVQHIRTADGCQRCECVTVEIDCEPLKEECRMLNCTYGINKTVGSDGCERCKCTDHPCATHTCAEGQRCVATVYRDAVEHDSKYSAECRIITKPGQCPVDETTSVEVNCRHECNDDADCRGVGKCCSRGCRQLCLAPVTTPLTLTTTTYAPELPAAPQALPQAEPEVAVAVGGKASLRCLFHGNPPPKITWRRGEITIDGSVGRYRLMSDGTLEIVSLYRNDTGVYICVADNGLGVATQEISLVVTDPERTPVGIAGDENAVITGELGKPLVVRCLVYGYPVPDVYWEHGGYMVAFNDAVYEIKGNSLLIRSLTIETLGQYTCQAYNGVGKAASWVVSVRAYRPEGFFLEHEYLVPRGVVYTTTRAQPSTTRQTTPTTSTTTTTERPILFTVPVNTHVTTPQNTLNLGAELHLSCEVDGYPEPNVHWTKNGLRIVPDDRIVITGSTVSRLVIARVELGDGGLYGCHANNGYTSHSSITQINVQLSAVPAKCTDNPFFANCDLIVRSKFCTHKYYSKFCCKSCVEAGQLDPQVAELQADQPYRKK